jgi:hypothetical protein
MSAPMYFVRVGFNRFTWTFQCETDDHIEAIRESVDTFLSGLTREERRDAVRNLDIVAHPYSMPLLADSDSEFAQCRS